MTLGDIDDLRPYIAAVSAIEYPLSRSAERVFAKRILDGDDKAVSTLGEAYAKLALEQAEAYFSREGWRGIPPYDFIHQANTGLFRAAKNYGSHTTLPFAEFARSYIKLFLNELVDRYRGTDG